MIAAFIVAASICGYRADEHVCSVQTTTGTVPTRAECVARGQEMIKNSTLVFGYIHVAGPYKTTIRCIAPDKKKIPTKPDATGQVDAPAPPPPSPPWWTQWLPPPGYFQW